MARVGGLMEYGSNWPLKWYGLQVFLSSEHTQMDTHIFKLTFQFSHFALKLFGCVACAVEAPTVLLCYCARLHCLTKKNYIADIKCRVILPSL